MSDAFRFVHCADVHLDTPYRSHDPGLRKHMAEAGRRSFRRVVDLCLEERVHALLIAGDLFDNDRLSFATESFLIGELGRCTAGGVQVLICCGNHDPGRVGARAQAIAWPDGVTLFRDGTPRAVAVHAADGQVVGHVVSAGHSSDCERGNLAARFPTDLDRREPVVGMLHTQVHGSHGAVDHKPYAPCAPQDLARDPYRYWALGHVHRTEQVLESPPAWYPGNLQGRHFMEGGPKGALLVEVARERRAPRVEFRELAQVRWETVVVDDLAAASNLDDLCTITRRRLQQVRQEAADDVEWVVKFELRGPCPLADELRTESGRADLAAEFQGLFDLARCEVSSDQVTRPVDLDEHRGQPHLLGLALESLEDALHDDELLDELAPVPLAGVQSEDPQERRRYLRSLLDGLDREIAERLLQADR